MARVKAAQPGPADMTTLHLVVENMSCPSCIQKIEGAQKTDDALLVRDYEVVDTVIAHDPCRDTHVLVLRDRVDLFGHDLADGRPRLEVPRKVSG